MFTSRCRQKKKDFPRDGTVDFCFFWTSRAEKVTSGIEDSGSFYGLLEMYRKVADATSKDAIWDYNTNDLEFVAVQELSLALSDALKDRDQKRA